MSTSSNTTARVQLLLDELHHGIPNAEERLLNVVQERFRLLAHQMLRRYERIRHLEDTDDLLQHTWIRLHNVLKSFRPESAQVFFYISSKHMRWILIDLARSYELETRLRINLSKDERNNLEKCGPQRSLEPVSFDEWAQFHTSVESLPDEEKEIVNLLYYQGLTQQAAAEFLGVSLRTVKLRWHSAKCRLSSSVNEKHHDQ